MAFKFPFTNYHELNLTWVLEQLKQLFEKSEENVETIETYDNRLSAVETEVSTLETTTSQAINTANAAATNAATALSRANTANQNALTASSQAGAAVTAAQESQQEAQAATQAAQQAQATAMTFDGRITQAQNDASAAVHEAESFENRVNAAINTANNAANTATIAQGIAVNANQTAAQGLDIAQTANGKANQNANNIGDLPELTTTAKADLVSAINEAVQIGSNVNVLLPITNYTIGNFTFSTATGAQEASSTRLCTTLISLRKGANIKFYPNALQYIYGYYNSSKSSFVASGSWASANVDFTMPYDGFFEIQFRKPNNGTITPEEFTDELIIKDSFYDSVISLRGCDIVNPDNFTGTDTEKLQAAIDALTATGGSILIERAYTLTANLICTHNSNTNRLLRFVGIGNASIDFASYSVVGGNADHTGAHGGIVFDGLLLFSNGTPRSVMFDGDTLIRIYIRNCCISGFASVVRADSTYIQSVFIDSCVIRSVTSIIVNDNNTSLYDLHMSNNVIEACRNVFVSYDSNGIFITNNLIEGLTGTPFSVRNTAHKILIDGNYFENNGSDNAVIESGAMLLALTSTVDKEISVTVSNNLIHQSIVGNINKCIVLPVHQVVGQVVISNNFCLAGGMLVSSPTTIKHQNVLYSCNTTHETEYDEGQYNCGDYVTVITASMINGLF